MASVLAKGQLSYLILSCLIEKDMYGLELIEQIKKRSGVEVKLPSLYSNLNRMKELKFISSYLKESTKGPKCAYSSITEQGRRELVRLKSEFAEIENNEKDDNDVVSQEQVSETSSSVNDDYNEFFAEIPDDNNENIKEKVFNTEKTESEEESQDIETILTNNEQYIESEKVNEQSFEADATKQFEIEKNVEETPKKDDAVFLTNDNIVNDQAREYNKRVFDVSMDYNKNKNRKSFAENQIEMVVNDAVPVEQQREKAAQNVNNLKEALLQIRQGNYDEVELINTKKSQNVIEEVKNEDSSYNEKSSENIEEDKDKVEKVADDGVFITDRVDYIPKTKRFEPPKFNFLNTQEEPLPAPKRDTSLDPNCSDIKAKLQSLYALSQSKKEEKQTTSGQAEKPQEIKPEKKEVLIDNFDDLKDYYQDQSISFKIYKRAEKKSVHNTNKLVFFVDLITLGVISIFSALFYLVFRFTNLVNPNTNFLYYLLPIIYLLYVGYRLYMYKRVSSKVPKPLYNFVVVWGSAVLLSGVIVCLNIAFGMLANPISMYLTSIILPISMIFAIFIIRHYVMLYTLKKYWR